MCEFLSIVLAKMPETGLTILAAESLTDHSDIISAYSLDEKGIEYNEAEWTIDEDAGEDVLDVRIRPDQSEGV